MATTQRTSRGVGFYTDDSDSEKKEGATTSSEKPDIVLNASNFLSVTFPEQEYRPLVTDFLFQ